MKKARKKVSSNELIKKQLLFSIFDKTKDLSPTSSRDLNSGRLTKIQHAFHLIDIR
ncbi:hypothetical protein [Bacillus sp. FJAT-50079]|uniref:hypothetical protein n=1 Tax=Bacillus sp. FJAT-50079 TaxID=2833577 RepID=UPI001BC9151A|nr:hypothetical protein [Bacillus sp. FJAT-50079]MBS4208956.1 hypothetical protein [Bacillus sp. FJAT-50079]